ncbi:MAG: diadenylate cyclase CdaA [Candidatus Kapabacteria bacterium]|nr:diadenylate cyclase CdaA [Ignavibacteriota bacterium]MCW5883696.1 diadenylate cyclase CdaA [Candidatus Kapabacteria bacterium]
MELFKIGFLTITMFDLLDIFIVATLFYYLYRALKNTVAVQILFGMVIIIALQFITEASNFRSLNWILRTISDVWLLAFVILFQPELRKLLLIITRSPIFKLFVKPKISESLDEIVDTIKELSAKHIGALLVFTRSQNVQMTVDTGVPMQAAISKELLMSIFNTKSPLHDGAVIINNDIILAARCVLPLTSVTKYGSKNLGTRHRAGLGLSEQVDTLVIIVSEETGGVTVADGGELIINIPDDQLFSIISSRLYD